MSLLVGCLAPAGRSVDIVSVGCDELFLVVNEGIGILPFSARDGKAEVNSSTSYWGKFTRSFNSSPEAIQRVVTSC